ncbi:glutathione S-transferase family protein [Parvularcula dongshanensis]|uniref:Putative glutathione S-transferase n=1 Tax=Parvularcula dongshanensis TaxID=1173995 RepID=A0A840I084_9PROT|nr:glutathione S-transferase family protein [Parvularcula dongshanensis]MBB4657683.1 putative glutathione S-transferase [Parvularcula dongshanensis]
MGGVLKDGEWVSEESFANEEGRYDRQPSQFRGWLTADGAPGPDGQEGFKAEADRYHLYVSYACPWAHRTLILRALKGIEEMLPISVTHWLMRDQGWTFHEGPGVIPDPMGHETLHGIYQHADPKVNGKATVPVLWDKKTERIVNNESSEIIRMLTRAFDGLGAKPLDTYPDALRSEIDEVNERVYHTVNNGVYKAGFAEKQKVYEEEVEKLFSSLRWLEDRLEGEDYLVGNTLTEADIRLLTTLLRFDAVYYGHFKCNVTRIADMPNLHRYMLGLARMPEVAGTIHLDHIKGHYYGSHRSINPTGIVPVGPELDFGSAPLPDAGNA